ncbi:MAG: filamentous hemagglutinin N-terminal domain-containing protein [Verrucomicrobiales bacterium]|nr:filamentous hemagglutinin N-terminal domain-containing protein [Verrucomicrobiales bacterium]
MKNIIPSLRRNLILQVLILAPLLPGLSFFTVPLQANPSGASVVHGNVAFNGLGTSQLNIVQGSQNAIINWQSFSIQNGEVTNFIQPNQNAMALNRVTGADPSAIYGSLNANGGVIVINPNGIVVGPGGRVDVAGMLTMSTLDMENEDFLDGGPMRFRGETSAGIRNYGAISSASGDVVLLGNFLQNSGKVSAATGTVAFGAGGDIVVNQTASGGKISVLAGGVGGENGIENTATGEINGAAAELKAHGNVYALAIKNDGVVRANGYNFSGGRLTLSGGSGSSVINTGGLYAGNSNGSGGRVEISGGNVSLAAGTIDASGVGATSGGTVAVTGDSVNVGNGAVIDVSGATAGSVSLTGVSAAAVDGALSAAGRSGVGGSIDVTAESVLVGSNAVVDVSGTAQGGSARLGGGFQGGEADIDNAESVVVEEGSLLLADSSEGDAGRIVVWADNDTTYEGEISARSYGQVGNGGFVEVSGKNDLYFNGLVSTLSANGANGTLLLDPTDVVIGDVGSATVTLVDTALIAALGGGNVVIHTSSAGTDDGNITVERGADLTTGYASASSLALFAEGDIIINDDIQNSGAGNITLFAGWDGTGVGNFAAQPAISFSDIADANNAAVTYGDWGQNGGDVVINGDGSGAVSVGSAHGETNAFGNQVIVAGGNGNDRFGQLGFGNQRDLSIPAAPALSASGAINIRAREDVILSSIYGDVTGNGRNDSFVMVGHGGSNTGAQTESQRPGDGDLSGDISVASELGSIIMHGGNDRSFVQIGHGGQAVIGDKDGNITVEGELLDMRGALLLSGSIDGSNRAGTRIGHGGYESYGGTGDGEGYSGDISVVITGSIYGDVAAENTNSSGANVVHFGHGGWSSGVVVQNGNIKDPNSHNGQGINPNLAGHTGNIHVEATNGDMTFFAGSRASSFVHIGNGGYTSSGNHSGDVTVIAGGDITLDRKVIADPATRGTADNSYVMIGNGGNRSGGAFSGNIVVDAGGNMRMQAGDNTAFAQVGHGGFADGGGWNSTNMNARNAYATLSGDIDITTGGDFAMYSGSNDGNAYSMVGHGGTYRIASGESGPGSADSGHHGNISVNSGGDVLFSAKPGNPRMSDVAGSINFTQLGHGGLRSNSDSYGTIEVNAVGDVSFIAGDGGWESYDVSDDRYDLNQTGDGNYALLGHGGFDFQLYGQQANNGPNYVFNGNAGVGIGVIGDSSITVNGGGNLLIEGTQQQGGKRQTVIDLEGAIDTDGTTPRPASERTLKGFAKVGHGGYGEGNSQRRAHPDSVLRGNIFIDMGGDVTMNAGGVQQEVIVAGAGDDNRVEYNHAQIGHGGAFTRTSFDGIIEVKAGGDIGVNAGAAYRDWAKIGHGGYESGVEPNDVSSTTMDGDILVQSGGTLSLTGGFGTSAAGGNNQFQFAQIGHGSGNRGQTVNSNITVVAVNDVNLTGGLTYQDGYSQIGHGALNNGDGNFTGMIDVTAGDNINLTSTTGNLVNAGTPDETAAVRNYAKIGHGDTDSGGRTKSTGTWNGDIFVKAGNDLTSVNGMIGHADPTNGDGVQRSPLGNTYLAVGRDDPTAVGSGNLILDADTVITSARFGTSGELRFYLPGVGDVDNFIAEGANLNTALYTRTPFPDGFREDEATATEFIFAYDAGGLPTGTFGAPPEGDMTVNSFGRYTIFYADLTQGPGGPTGPPFIFTPFFFGDEKYDAFDRYPELLGYDGYDGQLFSFSAEDVQEDESDPATGGWFFEEMLDASLGKRRDGRISEDGVVLNGERDEELQRRKIFASRKAGVGRASFYVFDPATNRYSSYRVFGVPQSSLTVAQ